MSQEQDRKSFFLFGLILVALTVLMIVLYILGGKYGGQNIIAPLNLKETPAEVVLSTPEAQEVVEEQPQAAIEVVQEAASETEAATQEVAAVTTDSIDAEAIYNKVCVACHAGAIPGIPKLGDKADWEPRIAQGMDVLYDHAINGYMGTAMMMPARGGGDLTDDEVKATVDYMVQSSQ